MSAHVLFFSFFCTQQNLIELIEEKKLVLLYALNAMRTYHNSQIDRMKVFTCSCETFAFF